MFRWTDENTDYLRNLWGAGLSASQIAEKLKGTTRNAVIGKINRLGLEARCMARRGTAPSHRTEYMSRQLRTRPIKQAPRIAPTKAHKLDFFKLPASPLPPPETADIPRVAFADIDFAQQCAWVCAPHVNNESPMYCGCKKLVGLPYCEIHARRAYQPTQPSRLRHYGDRPQTQARAYPLKAVLRMA